MKAEVIHVCRMDGIPSASGLARVPGGLLVAGDDSPFLFKVNEAGEEIERIRLFAGEAERIKKKEKADIEAIATLGNDDGFLLFGSGSKLPKRTTIVHLRPFGEPVHYAGEDFYRALVKVSGMTEDDLNIEGAACIGWDLYLLNRGGNVLIHLHAGELLRFLEGSGPIPNMGFRKFRLPAAGGHSAGFSGATVHPNGRDLIFCASVEATTNWFDDGEILNSYVGVIGLDGAGKGFGRGGVSGKASRALEEAEFCVPVTWEGKAYVGKIEAVEVAGVRERLGNGDAQGVELFAVTDDDSGGSELLRVLIRW